MSIHFACPKCTKRFKVPDDCAGRKSKCTACGQPLRVPVNSAITAAVTVPPMPAAFVREERRPVERAPRPALRDNHQTVIVQNVIQRSFPHGLHLIMTLLTVGLWLPIWIVHYLIWSLTR